MARRIRVALSSGVRLDMTPLIDIVFQLLAFFIFTLRILSPEGDFDIKMPLAHGAEAVQRDLPVLKLRLMAAEDGSLREIRLNDAVLPDLAAVRQRLVRLQAGDATFAERAEVELICDQHLAYQHAVDAMTAVSGYKDLEERTVPLVRKIRFAPPRRGGG